MRGIISSSAYLPHWRLQRSAVGAVLGSAAGKGTRTVASYDEDAVTLAVEAGRRALRSAGPAPVSALWFATNSPTYLDKTSAPIAHAALRLDGDVVAADAGPGLRGAGAALRTALRSTEAGVLVLAGDVRTGMAGSAEEREGGDAGAAVLVGDDTDGPLTAEYLGGASATQEFLDRWRVPGELRTRGWEERFGQQRYDELAGRAWAAALKDAGMEADQVARSPSPPPTPGPARRWPSTSGAAGVDVADTLATTVGFAGAAHPAGAAGGTGGAGRAGPGGGAGGAGRRRRRVPVPGHRRRPVAPRTPTRSPRRSPPETTRCPTPSTCRGGASCRSQPPNRPEPARMSASAAERRLDWKYGFVGSLDRDVRTRCTCPRRVCRSWATTWTTWNRRPWPTWPRPWPPSPSTRWRTRRRPRWCSRCATSRAAAGCRSSSPT